MSKIAVVSFPGNNCEVESIRCLKRVGIEPVFFRWNEDRSVLKDVDGYFLPGGFSYEDRGRAGMVAGRDPLLEFIGQEAEAGKVVIGNCNGAQILVESGLIPLGDQLNMSLARNVVENRPAGFLNEWVWVKPTCKPDRCATSDWETPMHLPIAHGEGRFTTNDADLIQELKRNDQLAFSYCDQEGNVSDQLPITPNGSAHAIAGICNLAGNVVALMPHPERTVLGDPYFASVKKWIEKNAKYTMQNAKSKYSTSVQLEVQDSAAGKQEMFIDTLITNNEERTVEQAARRIVPSLRLKQLRYVVPEEAPEALLQKISLFNPNKETAYLRRGREIFSWDPDAKKFRQTDQHPLQGDLFLRVETPQVQGEVLSGILYAIQGVSENAYSSQLLEIFANPHASQLYRLTRP